MPFLPPETVITDTGGEWSDAYRIRFSTFWIPEPGADGATLYGDLVLAVGAGTSSEVLVDGQADPRVQDLVNALSGALEGTGWTAEARKVLKVHQDIVPDEDEPTA